VTAVAGFLTTNTALGGNLSTRFVLTVAQAIAGWGGSPPGMIRNDPGTRDAQAGAYGRSNAPGPTVNRVDYSGEFWFPGFTSRGVVYGVADPAVRLRAMPGVSA